MSVVVAIDNLQQDPVKRIDRIDGVDTPIPGNMTFFRQSANTPNAPCAILNLYDIPGRLGAAHFHEVDGFQIIVGGKGQLGRHSVSPYWVHFSRAYTPYGPLRSDKDVGWAMLTLRTRYDRGAQMFPESQDKLKKIPNRRPWQVAKNITFPTQGPDIKWQEVPEFKDEQGLFVRALTMAPHTRAVAPDPSCGDGQFVVVFKGSLVHDDKEHKAMTVAFIKSVEEAFHIHAGAQGLEALVLNFPQVRPRAERAKLPSAAPGFKKWRCILCDFTYDEALGMPEEGVVPGTRWEDVPETWSCPDCSASKSDFELVEVIAA